MSHYIGITKEITDDLTFEEVCDLVGPIMDEFQIGAVTIEPTYYIWGNPKRQHWGVKIEWATETTGELCRIQDYLHIGGFVYAVNKAFSGAKAVLTIDGVTAAYYPGEHMKETD